MTTVARPRRRHEFIARLARAGCVTEAALPPEPVELMAPERGLAAYWQGRADEFCDDAPEAPHSAIRTFTSVGTVLAVLAIVAGPEACARSVEVGAERFVHVREFRATTTRSVAATTAVASST